MAAASESPAQSTSSLASNIDAVKGSSNEAAGAIADPTKKEAETDNSTPPSWIDNPKSFFQGETKQGQLLATGSARIHGSVASARMRAQVDARNNLVKAKGEMAGTTETKDVQVLPDGSRVTTTTSSTSTSAGINRSAPGTQLFKQNVQGSLSGLKELASWTSPDGVYWVLFQGDA